MTGYGGVGDTYAHRAALEAVNGPIPAGFHVHHRCCQRDCVNPAHLQALSAADHRALHAAERAAKAKGAR